jgi:hypothetical protein
MGNYINHTMQLLQFIEEALGRSVGITPQREGSISSNETVGGVERSVTQSSHATEEYFLVHDFTKLRALEVLLETAKYAYRGDNKVAQYILDGDMAQEMFNLDGGQFSEADYGLVMADSDINNKFRETMISLAQAGIQNDKLNFSSFIDVFTSESIADTRRKIETYEEEALQRAQDAATAQQDHEKQMLQAELENREDQQAHQMEIETLKSNTAIEIKLMELEAKGMESTPEITEEVEKPLDREKFEADRQLKERQLQESVRSTLVKERQKDEEIAIKKKVANKPTPSKSSK